MGDGFLGGLDRGTKRLQIVIVSARRFRCQRGFSLGIGLFLGYPQEDAWSSTGGEAEASCRSPGADLL